MNDSEVTEKEKREAEALARALDGDGSAENVPSDALEVAGLLRVSGEDAGLSDVRRDAVLKKLLASVEPVKRQVPWLRWLVPAGGLAAAVAIFALTFTARVGPAPLPLPDKELIEAQASVAAGNREAVAVLRDRMQQYRREIYKTLAEHYRG
ncbi:MAG TPA: hypothetical protein VM425_01960 [Myxococcota bacterium]|nr:hypothetical protein [Myxococcota bacterium]